MGLRRRVDRLWETKEGEVGTAHTQTFQAPKVFSGGSAVAKPIYSRQTQQIRPGKVGSDSIGCSECSFSIAIRYYYHL